MGLLLWPVFSTDHVQLNMQSHGGFKNFFKKFDIPSKICCNKPENKENIMLFEFDGLSEQKQN